MVDWLAVLLSPIVGAGAGTFFKKWTFGKQPPKKDIPPTSTSALTRQVVDIQEWREEAHELLASHERRLKKLQSEARTTRHLVDILLVLLLLSLLALYFFYNKFTYP